MINDQSLDIVLQQWVVGLTGLPGNLVRLRFQAAPPAVPLQNVDWAVVGFMSWTPDANAYLAADGSDPGQVIMQRHETDTALVSFAGPTCVGNAALVRDGAMVRQNRVQLAQQAGLYLVEVGQLRLVPDLINEVWVRRIDLELTFSRQLDRTYAIRRIESSTPTLINDPF